jgi:hypothetical protein
MYVFKNENPCRKKIGDCVIRAISTALNQQWERTYIDLCIEGYINCDLPNSNNVWASYLQHKGFKQYVMPYICTMEQFAAEYPQGTYIVATGSHVACIKDGRLIDNWDSSDETVTYYFTKE